MFVMATITSSVRSAIEEFITQHKDSTAEDVLRVFRDEANRMFETCHVRDSIRSDPFEHFHDIKDAVKRICDMIQVTDCHRTITQVGYTLIVSTIRIDSDHLMMRQGVDSFLELHFRYERRCDDGPDVSSSVWYSIELSKDYGPREKLLWVRVMAPHSAPSSLPAQNIDGNDEWEDMDEDIEGNAVDQEKYKISPTEKCEEGDKYLAGMDPDVLGRFLHWAQLGQMDEATAFFLLMSFPFYEAEWDLVGYVLDSVFGFGDEEMSEGKDDTSHDNSL